MRYVKIFLLHFQYVFEHRARSFLWFVIAIANPFLMILFWQGATFQKGQVSSGFSLSSITSYYFLLLIFTSLLTNHVEGDVSREDIKEGGLVKYLMKPFSYYWINFFEELPYRLIQGSFGILAALILIVVYGKFFVMSSDISVIGLSFIIILLAYFISFTYKMTIGLLAFWLTDISGYFQVFDVMMLIFGGYILPISLMPNFLEQISNFLPFSYMVYFPIIAFQGKMQMDGLFKIIIIQVFWLILFIFLYRKLWKSGLKKFTALGQ